MGYGTYREITSMTPREMKDIEVMLESKAQEEALKESAKS
jgi:hypothetical protein